MSATGPWRSPQPWMYFLNPEHTSPAVGATEHTNKPFDSQLEFSHHISMSTVGYLQYNVSIELHSRCCYVLTVSPGRGLSWLSMTDIFASWSSLFSVCTVLRAESISKGPQASWAFKRHTRIYFTHRHAPIHYGARPGCQPTVYAVLEWSR